MKKFIILILAALIGAWAGLTWIIGSKTQSEFSKNIEELDSNLGGGAASASIVEESYTRGFLASEAIAKISAAKQPDDEKKDIFLSLKAWHGPLMMTPAGIKLGAEYVLVTLDKERLPEDIRKIVDEGFKGKEPMRLGIFTGFGGDVAIDAEIAPFSSGDAGSNKINFEGFTGDLKTDAKTTYAKGKINIGALTMEGKKDGTLLSIANADGEINYTNMIMRVTGDGTSQFDFPEIKVTAGGGDYILKDLHFENASKQNSGKLNTTSKVSVGSFKGPEKGKYAEIMAKVNGKLEAEFTAEGMDTETLQLMADAQKKLREAQAIKDANPEKAKEALHDYLIAASSLLQPGYKMKNHIEFTNQGGKSEIGLGLEYAGKKPLYELASIRELLQALEIAVNLQIVKDLLPAALAKKIQPAMAMGFILDKDNFYKGGAILAGGELTVNGKATPALKQIDPMLDMPIPWEKFGMGKKGATESK